MNNYTGLKIVLLFKIWWFLSMRTRSLNIATGIDVYTILAHFSNFFSWNSFKLSIHVENHLKKKLKINVALFWSLFITKFSVFFIFSVVCFFQTLNNLWRMRLSKKKLSWPSKIYVLLHVCGRPTSGNLYTGQCLSSFLICTITVTICQNPSWNRNNPNTSLSIFSQ